MIISKEVWLVEVVVVLGLCVCLVADEHSFELVVHMCRRRIEAERRSSSMSGRLLLV